MKAYCASTKGLAAEVEMVEVIPGVSLPVCLYCLEEGLLDS